MRRSPFALALAFVFGASAYAGTLSVQVAFLSDLPIVQQDQKPAENKPVGPRTMKPDDYKSFERLLGPQISPDGRWLAYGIALIDGEGRVTIRNNDGPARWDYANGGPYRFSDDSKYVAVLMNPPKKMVDQMIEQGRPVPTKLSVRILPEGTEKVFDDVRSFRFLKGRNTLLVNRQSAETGGGGPGGQGGPGGPGGPGGRGPSGPPSGGPSDLVLMTPEGEELLVIPSVTRSVLNKEETLALAEVRTGSGYTTLQLIDLKTAQVKTLKSDKDAPVAFGWAEEVDVAFFAMPVKNEKKIGNNHKITRVEVGNGLATKSTVYDPAKTPGFPDGMRINEAAGVDLSPDGKKIAIGMVPWEDREANRTPEKDKPGVEVWSTNDIDPIPLQKMRANQARSTSVTYVWDAATGKLAKATSYELTVGKRFGNNTLLTKNFDKAINVRYEPYRKPTTNGIEKADLEVVDVATGEARKVFQGYELGSFGSGRMIPSPEGGYVALYHDKFWWTLNLSTGKLNKLAPKEKVTFEDSEDDHTVANKPSAASPRWFEGDKGLVVYDEFDAWMANPETGEMTRLTSGRKESVEYRLMFPEGGYQDLPKVTDRLYFATFDKETKQDGFALSDGKGGVKQLFADDAVLGSLIKAKDGDRYMFVMSSFDKSPNVYITNGEFTAAKPVTKTNPQLTDYLWGKRVAVSFKSKWGAKLQGTLYYPADYKPGTKYPMVTYIYERLSDERNAFLYPSEWSAYNEQHFIQNGYFVFKPDIAYRDNRPGESAVECLEPAVDAALKLAKDIDPSKVGLIGHSWGAYQTAFVTTVSKKFAVGACGAPLTELTSMYNSYYWNSGSPNGVIFESGQGRMRVPFWEDPKAYFDNSPVWQSTKRQTPILVAFGDKDGAVDWSQGIFYFNTLRRMGKEMVMLVYAGENHGLARRPNQLDYAKRLRHFLDVHLKGQKAEPWVKEGVPYLDQVK